MRKGFAAATILLSLALAGFGCAGTPTVDVIKEMKAAMLDVSSASYVVTIEGDGDLVDVPSSTPSSEARTGGQAAPIEKPDTIRLELSGQTARGQSSVANVGGRFSASTTGEQAFSVGGEFRMVNGLRYVRLSEVPTVPGFNTAALKNVWIQMAGDMTDLLGEQAAPDALTEEQIKKFEKLFLDTDLFSEVTKVGEEVVRGQSTNMYQVILDAEAIAGMAEQAALIQAKTFSAEDKQDVLDAVAQLNMVPGKLWIGASDDLLYRTQFTMKKEGESGQGTVTVELYDFNKPVEAISAPEGAKSLESVIGSMFGFGMVKPSPSATQGLPGFDPSTVPGLTPEMLKQLQNFQQ